MIITIFRVIAKLYLRLYCVFFTANKSHCPEEIVKKTPSTVGFSTVDLYLADGSPVQLQLPPGVYPIKHRNNDTNCSDITITVAAFGMFLG